MHLSLTKTVKIYIIHGNVGRTSLQEFRLPFSIVSSLAMEKSNICLCSNMGRLQGMVLLLLIAL